MEFGNSNGNSKSSILTLRESAIELMSERGVEIEDIAEIVYNLQIDYLPELTIETCCDSLNIVLSKREVLHSVLTGIAIDQATEKGLFPEPIQSIIASDEGLYGVDETLALSITNIHGSIGLTNFGYLDKIKPGVIREIDEDKEDECHTFLDDIIAALAAAAASRIAHYHG